MGHSEHEEEAVVVVAVAEEAALEAGSFQLKLVLAQGEIKKRQ
jgi:hypothetical protein